MASPSEVGAVGPGDDTEWVAGGYDFLLRRFVLLWRRLLALAVLRRSLGRASEIESDNDADYPRIHTRRLRKEVGVIVQLHVLRREQGVEGHDPCDQHEHADDEKREDRPDAADFQIHDAPQVESAN